MSLTYQQPHPALAAFVSSPWTPRPSLSPTKDWLLLLAWSPFVPLVDLTQPEARLAGVRFNP